MLIIKKIIHKYHYKNITQISGVGEGTTNSIGLVSIELFARNFAIPHNVHIVT